MRQPCDFNFANLTKKANSYFEVLGEKATHKIGISLSQRERCHTFVCIVALLDCFDYL